MQGETEPKSKAAPLHTYRIQHGWLEKEAVEVRVVSVERGA